MDTRQVRTPGTPDRGDTEQHWGRAGHSWDPPSSQLSRRQRVQARTPRKDFEGANPHQVSTKLGYVSFILLPRKFGTEERT